DVEDFTFSVDADGAAADHGLAVEGRAPFHRVAAGEPRVELVVLVHAVGRLAPPTHFGRTLGHRVPAGDQHAVIGESCDGAHAAARLHERDVADRHAVAAMFRLEAAVECPEHDLVVLDGDAARAGDVSGGFDGGLGLATAGDEVQIDVRDADRDHEQLRPR